MNKKLATVAVAVSLRTELESAKTIADVAKAHNVDVQKVIDAVVADMNSHAAADLVNGKLPARGDGPPRGGTAPNGTGSSAAPAA